MSLIPVSVFAAVILVGAIWVVTLRNLFRAALSLGLVLLGVAGLFLLFNAEFLAFVQVLVYVGAVLTLVIFAIMLTAHLQTDTSISASRQQAPAAIVALGLFGLLSWTTHAIAWPLTWIAEPVSLATLGQQLVTTLILPFEVISLVFVVAMIGAMVLATTRRSTPPSR